MVYRKSRDTVTTTIDPYLKQAFEAVKDKIGKSYRDILEEGIEKELMNIDPVEHLKHKLKLRALEDDETRQQISNLEILHPEQRQMTEFSDRESALEKQREEAFQKRKKDLVRMWKKDQAKLDFTRLIQAGLYRNRIEALDWHRKRMERENV